MQRIESLRVDVKDIRHMLGSILSAIKKHHYHAFYDQLLKVDKEQHKKNRQKFFLNSQEFLNDSVYFFEIYYRFFNASALNELDKLYQKSYPAYLKLAPLQQQLDHLELDWLIALLSVQIQTYAQLNPYEMEIKAPFKTAEHNVYQAVTFKELYETVTKLDQAILNKMAWLEAQRKPVLEAYKQNIIVPLETLATQNRDPEFDPIWAALVKFRFDILEQIFAIWFELDDFIINTEQALSKATDQMKQKLQVLWKASCDQTIPYDDFVVGLFHMLNNPLVKKKLS